MTDKEFADRCHMLIHSLRLINGYKPSNAETQLSRLVIERFKDECKECKDREEQIKNIKPAQGFMDKIKGALE